MSNILKGIFEAPPKDIDSHRVLTKGMDIFTPSKYTIVDGLGRYVGDIYNSYSEAEKELSKFKNKHAQVKIVELPKKVTEDLRKWFKEKWVRFNPQGKIMGACARGSDKEGKPKCLPQAKAQALGKKGRKYAASKKRREDPNPERTGPAKNVATKKKTNEMAEEGNLTEIALKFKTIELSNDNIVSYAKNYFESNNIEAPHQKFISNIKLLNNAKLTESKENGEIQEFLKALARIDTKKKIKVGDKFAVLAFEIRFAWREIDALGFTEPKEVADINLHRDGTINYIKFTDGDRYPRLIQATRNNNPIIQAVYFDDKNKAEKALTYLTMIIPDNWEIDLNSLVRQETKKDVTEEQLDELKCWPGYTRVQGVPAGAPGSCKKKTNERVQGMDEGKLLISVKKWAAQVRQDHGNDTKFWNDKTHNRIIARKDNEIVGSYDRKANNGTVFSPEQDAEFNGDLDSKGRFTKDTVQKMFGKLSPDAKNIKEEKDPVWNKGTPMPKDYTCHCGIAVHPSVRDPKAIHIPDCPYAKKKDVEEGSHSLKTFTVVYYSPKTDKNVTKTTKAATESEIWDTLQSKGINVVSVKEQVVAEGILGDIGDEIKHGIKGIKRQMAGKPSRQDVKDKYRDKSVAARHAGDEEAADKNAKRWLRVHTNTNNSMIEQGVAETFGDPFSDERLAHVLHQMRNKDKDSGMAKTVANLSQDKKTKNIDQDNKSNDLYDPYDQYSANPSGIYKEQDIKEEKCPHCNGPMFSEKLMMEKKDACYYKVKSRYKVWPSAYASGALVKCRKQGAKNWGTKSESAIMRGIQNEGGVDRSKFSPGAMFSHGLLGDIEIVKLSGNSVIVKDSTGRQYRLSVTSVLR